MLVAGAFEAIAVGSHNSLAASSNTRPGASLETTRRRVSVVRPGRAWIAGAGIRVTFAGKPAAIGIVIPGGDALARAGAVRIEDAPVGHGFHSPGVII